MRTKQKKEPFEEATLDSQPNLTEKTIIDYQFLEAQIPELLKKYDVPAVSVAHIKDGEIAWDFVYGMQDEKMEANKETLFLTASIAKPMTAEVFLRLAAEGKVSLDEPMANHWLDPDIAGDPRAKLLTPRHVLTHETGFKNWRYLTEGKLRFERDPGQEMGYSGEGLQYLVRFVENKLNQDFNTLAREVLFAPENMQNTSMKEQDWYEGRLASPKFPDGNWRMPRVRKEVQGAGGVHTNAKDYARFVLSIMTKETVPQSIRKEQFNMHREQSHKCDETTKVAQNCPETMGFGLGWYIYDYSDELVIGHTGANNGERTLAVFSPGKKWGFVAMTNGANGNYVMYDIAKKVGVHEGFIAVEGPKKPFSDGTK